MTRTIIIVLFFLCIHSIGFSQSFTAHLTGGFNASQIDGDLFAGYNKLGIHGGIGITYSLDDTWSLETGLFYNELGSQKELQIGSTAPEEQEKIKLSYISVPIALGYTLQSIPLNFGMGLQFSSLINSSIQEQANDAVLEFFNKTDIAGFLSARYQFNDLWSISIRASESISLIFNNDKVPAINSNSLRNRYLTFSFNRHL